MKKVVKTIYLSPISFIGDHHKVTNIIVAIVIQRVRDINQA